MERVFYRKWTAAIFVAAILIVVLLLCMLLVTLTQWSSLNARADALVQEIQKAKEEGRVTQELWDRMQKDDWIRQWAEDHDRISKEDIIWVQEHKPN